MPPPLIPHHTLALAPIWCVHSHFPQYLTRFRHLLIRSLVLKIFHESYELLLQEKAWANIRVIHIVAQELKVATRIRTAECNNKTRAYEA